MFYTVDNPSKSWRGGTGYISKDMAVKGLPGPSDDTLILVSVALMLRCFNFHMLIYFIMIWHQHKPAVESHSKCLFILSSIKVCLCPTCGHAGDTLACVSSLCRECKKKFCTFIYVLKI